MILKNRKIYSSYIWILILIWVLGIEPIAACKRKKEIKPDWIEQSIKDDNYYFGLGYASIVKIQNTHLNTAKNEAINDIASQISVQIFSSNILVTIANDKKHVDEYNALIRSKVNTELEGYELVETYANKKEYWVLYRLSKSLYQEQQAQKRADALSLCMAHFAQAEKYEQSADYKNALVFYIKSLDAIKLYLTEKLQFEWRGEHINPAAVALANIAEILSSIHFKTATPSISTTFTHTLDNKDLQFSLWHKNGKSIRAFPVLGYYSERSIADAARLTDQNGNLQFDIGKIKSEKAEQFFKLEPDINRILLESSADYLVRNLIQNIAYETITIPIKVSKPKFQLIIKEKREGRTVNASSTQEQLKMIFHQQAYPTADKTVDYHCYINIDIRATGIRNGIYSSSLNGTIRVTNTQGQTVYNANLDTAQGMQLTAEQSEADAIKNFIKQFENRGFRAMIEELGR